MFPSQLHRRTHCIGSSRIDEAERGPATGDNRGQLRSVGLQEDRVSCCFFGFTLEFFSSSGKTPLVQLEHAFDASVPWPIPIPQRDGLPVSMGLGARQMALMVCDYL